MTDWIDALKQQHARAQKSQEWQAHYAQVFPALAERFWEHLLVLLERDVQKMNRELRDALGSEITTERPVAGHLGFRKVTYPAHYIEVSLEVDSYSLKIEHARTGSSSSETSVHTERINLSLDDQHRNIYVKDDEQVLSPEQVSELILSRLLA